MASPPVCPVRAVRTDSAGINAHGRNPRAIAVMAEGREAEVMARFRSSRDDIRRRVADLAARLDAASNNPPSN